MSDVSHRNPRQPGSAREARFHEPGDMGSHAGRDMPGKVIAEAVVQAEGPAQNVIYLTHLRSSAVSNGNNLRARTSF